MCSEPLHELCDSTWEFIRYQQGQVISIALCVQAPLLSHARSPSTTMLNSSGDKAHPMGIPGQQTPSTCSPFGLSQNASFKYGADPSYHTLLHPILFSHHVHGLEGGTVKCTLDVQKSSQSDKPIRECPLNLINKTGEPSLSPASLVCMLIHSWYLH
jgi:hypothetical protein